MAGKIYIQAENNDKLREECGVYEAYGFGGSAVSIACRGHPRELESIFDY